MLQEVRDKGLRDQNITLEDLLKHGWTVESTKQQSMAMTTPSTSAESVHAISKYSAKSHNKYTKNVSANKPARVAPPVRKYAGCGGPWHDKRMDCVAWGKRCRKCNCLNHFASQCAYQYTADRTGHTRKHDTCNDTYNLDLYQTNIVTSHTINRVEPYLCKITLNGVSTTMEIDTGASSTLINEEQFTQLKQGDTVLHLQTEGVPSLRTYAGGIIQPIGKLTVSVEYENNLTRLLQLLLVLAE